MLEWKSVDNHDVAAGSDDIRYFTVIVYEASLPGSVRWLASGGGLHSLDLCDDAVDVL
jgi:hypothetical protein